MGDNLGKKKRVVIEVPETWVATLGYVADGEEKRGRRHGKRKQTEKPKARKPAPARLPADDVADLEFYWNQFDALCGLRSSWFEQAEAMDECAECGYRFEAKSRKVKCPGCGHLRGQTHHASLIRCHSGQGSAWHPGYDNEILGVVTSSGMERADRVRYALIEMVNRGYSRQVSTLYRAYGDLNRYAPFGHFGDLAQIVTLTGIAHQLSKKYNLPERQAIEQRLRLAGADLVVKSLRESAEKMLIDAGAKYTACK